MMRQNTLSLTLNDSFAGGGMDVTSSGRDISRATAIRKSVFCSVFVLFIAFVLLKVL